MRRNFLLMLVVLVLISTVPMVSQAKTDSSVTPRIKDVVKQEIEMERAKQVKHHLKEISNLSLTGKKEYLKDYGLKDSKYIVGISDSINSEKNAKIYFEQILENAIIYTMDDNGYVYDRNGEVVNKLDLNKKATNGSGEVSVLAINSSIDGSNSGAFVRQTTSKGYKGIRTTLTLPAPANFTPSDSTVVGYLYNGIDIFQNGSGGAVSIPYRIEAGLQYSPTTQSYTAVIHPTGQPQDAIPEGATNAPLRYKNNTSIVSNLLYDTVSSQFKYFVNGTNVNNANQYIYFYYSKTLTSQNRLDMVVKRVTALAKAGYTGTDIGDVTVSYSGTELTKSDGTTVNLTSSLLSTHTYLSKIFGTADAIDSTGSVTKSPATGNIYSQTINIDS